jgi:hypothetical protein
MTALAPTLRLHTATAAGTACSARARLSAG